MDFSLHQIIINLVAQCPTSWPSSSNCLQVNFSVKLEENEVPTELTSEHLEELWDMYRDTDELIHLGLWVGKFLKLFLHVIEQKLDTWKMFGISNEIEVIEYL